MVLHEPSRMDENVPRTAGWVEDSTLCKAQYLHDELGNGLGCIDEAALLALTLGEFTQEVLAQAQPFFFFNIPKKKLAHGQDRGV